MIQINLLPVREWRKKEAVRQQISIFILSLTLILTVLIAVGLTIQGRVRAQRLELKQLEKQKLRLSYVNQKIKTVNKKTKEVEEKFKAIEKLQKGRTLTVKTLDELVSAIPIDRLWLTNLSLKNNRLTISGVALDNHTVALFMRRLEDSPVFSWIRLKNTSLKPVQGHDLMEFGINMGIAAETTKKKKSDPARREKS